MGLSPTGMSASIAARALSSPTTCRLFRKHSLRDCVGRSGVRSQPNLHGETEASEAPQVMVSTTLPPTLFGCVFSTMKWHPLFQHAIKNDQHEMSHRATMARFSPRLGASR